MLYIVVKGGVFMEWVQVVSTLGFPIAMCAALCWFINKKDEQTNKTIISVTNAINGLTEKINELIRKDG